jgi:hypothetical protein
MIEKTTDLINKDVELLSERDKKIIKLKKKILKEINSLLEMYKAEASQTEIFEFAVKNSFALIKLRDYTCNPASFNQMWNKSYIISDLHIDMWLQEDYSFAFNFLYNVEEHNYDIIPLLNDNFFELYFTDIVDEALYKQKLQKNCSE